MSAEIDDLLPATDLGALPTGKAMSAHPRCRERLKEHRPVLRPPLTLAELQRNLWDGLPAVRVLPVIGFDRWATGHIAGSSLAAAKAPLFGGAGAQRDERGEYGQHAEVSWIHRCSFGIMSWVGMKP